MCIGQIQSKLAVTCQFSARNVYLFSLMPAPHTSCSLFQALLTEKELLPQSPVHLDAPVMLMVLYFFTFFFFSLQKWNLELPLLFVVWSSLGVGSVLYFHSSSGSGRCSFFLKHGSIILFAKYLRSPYYKLGTVLGTEEAIRNKNMFFKCKSLF